MSIEKPEAPGEGKLDMAALAAKSPEAEREEAMEEVRQLITDLRDAAQDGRALARRYAEVLQSVVDEYCTEFEQRAEAALQRLEALD
jgi:phage I-like protein